MTSEEAIAWCHANIYNNKFQRGQLSDAALLKGLEGIVDKSCAEDIGASQGIGCDNITACIVEFNR